MNETDQFANQLVPGHDSFAIAEVTGEVLFEPELFGLKTTLFPAGCRRG